MVSDIKNLKIETVKAALDIGIVKAAALFGVHRSSVSNWVKAYKKLGERAFDIKVQKTFAISNKMPANIEEQIIRLKTNNPAFSAAKIKSILNLDYSVTVINKKIRQLMPDESMPIISTESSVYEFRIYTKKIIFKDNDQTFFATIIEDARVPIYFVAIATEKSYQYQAVFCDYFFSQLKDRFMKNNVVINLVVTNQDQYNKQKAQKEIIKKHKINVIVDQPKSTLNFEKKIFTSLNNLPAETDALLGLYTVLLLNNVNILEQLNNDEKEHFKKLYPLEFLFNTHPLLLNFNYKIINTSEKEEEKQKKSLDCLNLIKSLADSSFKKFENQKAEFMYNLISECLQITKNYSLQLQVYHQLGVLNQRIGDFKKADYLFHKALTSAQKNKDQHGVLRSNTYLGVLATRSGNLKNAEMFYQRQIILAKKLSQEKDEQNAYKSLGVIYQKRSNYKLALKYYNLVLDMVEKTGDLQEKAVILGNIGIVYQNKCNYRKSKEYLDEAIFLAERENNKKQLVRLYINLGVVLEATGQNIKALDYFNKMYELAKKQNNLSWQGVAICNVGQINLKLGNYPVALDYFKIFLQKAQKTGEQENISIAYGNLGCVYQAIGSYQTAENNYKKAIAIAENIESFFYLCSFYYYLADLYYLQKKYGKAQKYDRLAQDIAKQSERSKIVFSAGLALKKIAFNLNCDKTEALKQIREELTAQLKGEKEAENIAEINYTLYIFSKIQEKPTDSELYLLNQYKLEALKLYEKFYKKSSAIIFMKRIEELKGFKNE